MRERLLSVGPTHRGGDRLDTPASPEASLPALVAAAEGAARLTLWGGEPSLRADLPQLIEALAPASQGAGSQGALGMRSDGLALTDPRRVEGLLKLGLRRVRLPLHGFGEDGGFAAHDWLVGLKGAGRRTAKAVRACRAAGLEVEVEVTLTRPNTARLAHSVEAAYALGAHRVLVRRLHRRGPAAARFLALSPRLALAEPQLIAAAELAAAQRRPLAFVDLPACALGRYDAQLIESSEIWLPTSSGEMARLYDPPPTGRCAGCDRHPRCPGAPADYTERFGWAELRSEDAPREQSVNPPAQPAARLGLFPATRVAQAREAARGDARADARADVRPEAKPAPLPRRALRLTAPLSHACELCAGVAASEAPEPTRAIRQRLVQLAEQGASTLELGGPGALAHPEIVELLRDAVVLGFAHVEASGDGAALAALPRKSLSRLRRLRPVDRLDLALYGPDAASHDAHCGRAGAFAATLGVYAELQERTPAAVGLFAVLHQAEDLEGFAAAWAEGRLPGSPAYRLMLRDGELGRLARAAEGVDVASRAALAGLLPVCKLPGERGQTEPAAPVFQLALPASMARQTLDGPGLRTAFGRCPEGGACEGLSGCPGPAISWGRSEAEDKR